jgi:hypothetical protein
MLIRVSLSNAWHQQRIPSLTKARQCLPKPFVCCDKERYSSCLRRFPPSLSFPHASQIMLHCIFPLPYVFSISPGSGS